MESFTPPFKLLAQAPPGLEPLLLKELAELGIQGTVLQGGVRWIGGWNDLLRANLWLRTGSRVLIELGSFRVRALGELERKAAALPWSHLPPGPVRFRISASRSRLYHEGAIEERLRRAGGLPATGKPATSEPAIGESPIGDSTAGESVGESEQGPLLVVRVHRDTLTIRLDASGEHLHRRGYRVDVGEAPVRETLAAALLLTLPSGGGDRPLIDPFCGSGTLPIEAALLRRKIPPGMASPGFRPRDYAFSTWAGFPHSKWAEQCAEAQAAILPPLRSGELWGSDRDTRMVEAAQRNAARAGVEGDIAWSSAPVSKAPLPEGADAPRGWVVTNPPWGGRLGDRSRLRALYGSFGGGFRPGGRLDGWGLRMLSGDPVLTRTLGIPVEAYMSTTQGGLPIQGVGFNPRDAEGLGDG